MSKEVVKKLFDGNGVLKEHRTGNVIYRHIAINMGTNNDLAKSIDKYLHENDIDSGVVKNTNNSVEIYLRVYGNKDCEKFMKLING